MAKRAWELLNKQKCSWESKGVNLNWNPIYFSLKENKSIENLYVRLKKTDDFLEQLHKDKFSDQYYSY